MDVVCWRPSYAAPMTRGDGATDCGARTAEPRGRDAELGVREASDGPLRRPTVVTVALVLLWLNVVGSLALSVEFARTLDVAGALPPWFTPALLGGVLLAALLTVLIGRGHGWARVALIVIVLLGLLPPLLHGLGLQWSALLAIVAAVLLTLPSANRWFAQQRPRRAPRRARAASAAEHQILATLANPDTRQLAAQGMLGHDLESATVSLPVSARANAREAMVRKGMVDTQTLAIDADVFRRVLEMLPPPQSVDDRGAAVRDSVRSSNP